MKITALRLHNVKRFAGRGVAIEEMGEGVNVLSAANEFGKTTSFEALYALFFLPYGSKGKEAAALRPYSGGSPVIEADVETEAGKFRLSKRYYAGAFAQVKDLKSGQLIAQNDEAEEFLKRLVRGGSAGPAAMLWVRQGNTGLEKRKAAEEESERGARETLLQSVQGEVEAVTGGRRMAEIMRGVSEEYLALVTATGRPKSGGLYAAAISERDRLAQEEARLGAEVAELREALDQRAKVQSRLADLTNAEAAAEREQNLQRAGVALKAAQEQKQQVQAAQTALELAREKHENAKRKVDEFAAAEEQLRTLHADLVTRTQARDDAQQRRAELRAEIADAQLALATADEAEVQARALLDRLTASAKAQEAAAKLAELGKKLEGAEAARAAIDECEALCKQLHIGADKIEILASLDVEIAQTHMLRKAARPMVQMAYAAGVAGGVVMDGAALRDGEERDYGNHAELQIYGLGTMTLRTPWEEDSSRVEQLEAQRQKLLTQMGVPDLAAARAQQAKADDHKNLARENQIQLKALVPDGIAALRVAIAACQVLAAEAPTDDAKHDPAEVRRAYDLAVEQRRIANDRLRALNPASSKADDAYHSALAYLTEVTVKVEQLQAILGPEAEQAARRMRLEQALEPVALAWDEANARYQALTAEAIDLEGAEANFARHKSVFEAARTAIEQENIKLAELGAQIRTRAGEAVEEAWRETQEALSAAEKRVAAFEREVAVLRCLMDTLEAARSEARDLYLKPVMSELKPLLAMLFEDVSIQFDEKTLLPEKLVRAGLEEEVDRLSGGMREQLSILTRLAFARLLAKDGRPAPVILDDALVYSDDERIEKMFDALHRQARSQQIIVFSCRQRAFEKLGGTVLQMADWTP